jgi:hypothetical protein
MAEQGGTGATVKKPDGWVLDDVPQRVERREVEQGPEGETSLQLLQTVYKDRKQPLNIRVRCAVEALAHEYPRVSAVAVSHMDGQDFATALERAIERSKKPTPTMIEAQPVEQISAEKLKGPFPVYRNNYRRR